MKHGGSMKRGCLLLLIGILCGASISGCAKKEEVEQEETTETKIEAEKYLGESMENVQLFPTSDRSFVGDPMPYYENGKFHIFYLEDLRDGKATYHPWTLYETSNFYEYENRGIVIPYADTLDAQDAALGTGSVIKDKNGLYHAYYTGHNDAYSPKEAIMHATSEDMINWTKMPEDTFFAEEAYSKDDFRDPYVLYVEEEGQYWMLVTARSEDQGVLVKYTSKDLTTWTHEGIFFVNDMGSNTNLECPSLLQYQGKWYLSFSDQWPDRQFHYRVSDSVYGPFEKPEQDVVDGNGFYAGRLETDGENLYAFGWNGTKNEHFDGEDYAWGGNLVVHQLKQQEDGTLVPVLNTKVKEKMNRELSLKAVRMTETIQMDNDRYVFAGEQYEVIEFQELLGSYLYECTIKNFKNGEGFGIAFHTDENAVGALNILFNMEKNRIEFYNTDNIYKEKPQSEMDMNFENLEEIKLSMLVADGVVSVYVNEQCAMTARMYASQGTTWGLFGINSEIQCENMKIYK